MINLLAIMIILVIAALAVRFLVLEKRKGAACIGCPYSGECQGCHSLDDFVCKKD